ncbi:MULTISPECIES: hypothetical protein [unclassified Bradyrhizobium]|uniref:hypothetical protein n=1 Tax=unclassified Bradyrhizobium TaxID=2631580 RepID=UPI001FF9DB2C|nr:MULTISPECIES: hypothetical protein [unclassified Bradyrhizobium]MCK1269277.1 hypothetical protein [Bradyrhizobium sp. 84]MCK1374983.1 hypothetical protein [Bradyrhizobium sp. 49]MCK1417859.1 hypothetical protein [Bradyrhizobium sp. CW4]MCK1426344.1 hypothetical protein [Bradyrhizobium sp. 87]
MALIARTITRATCVLTALALLHAGCFAQSVPERAPRLTMQGAAAEAQSRIIRDALGRPCLDVEAAARTHAINPDLVDHVISVKNNCPRKIEAKICYLGSDRCNSVTVDGFKRVDTILGSANKVRFFRYSVLQK